MEPPKETLTPLYQCLDLEVDVDKAILRGRTSMWLRHLPNPSANGRFDYDSYPAEVALHCRQSKVLVTKVNGGLCASTYLDGLEDVVSQDGFRDAETFDICFRAKLWASAQSHSGELKIQVPPNSRKVPDLPPELPSTAPPAARAGREETVRLIQKSRKIEERREAKRKQGSRGGSGFPPQSPDISMMSPAHPSPASHMDSPAIGGGGGGGGGAMDVEDSSDDENYDVGEVKSAAVEAHRRRKREEYARVICIEVEWELIEPQSGVVFKTAREGFSGNHMYTTYSHAPMDMDGPRCWFPCVDHASVLITYDVSVRVMSPKITAAFNGRLLETTDLDLQDDTLEEVAADGAGNGNGYSNAISGAAESRTRCTTRYRFSTETLTAARAVGLAVGRFATWDVPQAPRVKGLVLRASPAGGGGRNGNLKPEHRRAVDSSLSAAAGALLAHVPAAIVFLEDWLKTDYPFKRCTHVFVEGLPELFAPFGSLCLVKAELLCAQDDRIPDGDLPGDARLSVVEVLLYGWVSTAIRLEGGKHRWLVHGIAGYLLTKFAAELRGEEDKQHRLWSAVQKAVALDCDLGCPSISPPTPDLYIPDAIDPATAYYARLKAVLILHMAEVKLQPTDMQDALSDVMRPIALHVREPKPDLSLRRQTSTFSLSRQASNVSVSVSVSHHEATEDQAFGRQASVASTVNSEAQRVADVGAGEVGGHFMQPLTDMNFLLLVRTMAARGGHDLGKDLTEGFYHQWVIGQCVPYLRVGYHYKKKANVINLVMEQVVPPWMSGIACHGPLTVEVWESDSLGGGNDNGPRRFREQLPPSRDEKKSATHVTSITRAVQSKSRRKRKPTTITPRNSTPFPAGASSSAANSTSTSGSTSAPAGQGGGGGGGPATAPGAAGSGGRGGGGGGGARSGFAGMEEAEEEEVDPERQAMFQAQDSNPSPVLWVKVDPQLEWIMSVRMRKPWHQWVEQLFSDESVEAQCDALRGLVELPLPFELRNSELPVQAIAEAVRGRVSHTQMEHASCVRKEAAIALGLWQNHHAPPHAGGFGESIQTRTQNWRGLEHLLKAFAERFEQRDNKRPGMGLGIGGSLSAANRKSALLLPNWFDDATEYRLKKALIWAAANMRARDGCTPLECLDLLVILLRENDNCENSLSDDYYVAQVLTALGQVSTTQEAGLPASSVAEAISQARLWLDLDMLGLSVSTRQSSSAVGAVGAVARAATRPTKSHNGVVAACALQCLCQLEMLRGGRPEVDYEAFTQYRHPTNVRIAAAQSVIQIFLAYDSGLKEEEDKGEGLSAALLWVLDFVESEENAGDTRPKYWAIRCLLDALERRPLVASHLARFQTDDPLLGECDPWAGYEFFTPQGPGRAAYRPDGPLPKDFPRAAEAAERLWKLMNVGTAYDQGLRHLCFQLWRNIWGLETPPCLSQSTKDKGEGWLDRLVVGESRNVPKDKRARMRAAVDGMVDKVRGWVMGRNKRREWINRDWGEWYYRDRERQTRLANKRKGDDEEEDITANPWDGRYGPEPPEETVQHQPQGFGVGVHSVQGVVQWEDAAAASAGSGEAGGGAGR
eukprot:g1685.t1